MTEATAGWNAHVFWRCCFVGTSFVKGFDYITNQLPTVADASNSTPVKATDTQGWNIGDIYKRDNNEIYKSLLNQQLIISIGSARVQKSTAVIPIIAENKSNATFTLRAELISSVDQDPLAILKRVLNGAVLFQGDSLTKELVAIPAEQARRKVIVQIFVESSDGDTLSARRTLNLSGYRCLRSSGGEFAARLYLYDKWVDESNAQ